MNKSPSIQIKESPNRDICDVLERLAIQERNNGQPFKERAYQKAIRSIAAYPTRLSSGKEAQALPGVGDRIAKKIDQFLETVCACLASPYECYCNLKFQNSFNNRRGQ